MINQQEPIDKFWLFSALCPKEMHAIESASQMYEMAKKKLVLSPDETRRHVAKVTQPCLPLAEANSSDHPSGYDTTLTPTFPTET